jgi:hypothetical protein
MIKKNFFEENSTLKEFLKRWRDGIKKIKKNNQKNEDQTWHKYQIGWNTKGWN